MAAKVAPAAGHERKVDAGGPRKGAELWKLLHEKGKERGQQNAVIDAFGGRGQDQTEEVALEDYNWGFFRRYSPGKMINDGMDAVQNMIGLDDVLDPYVKFELACDGTVKPQVKQTQHVLNGGVDPDFKAEHLAFTFAWPGTAPPTEEQAALRLQRVVRGRNERRKSMKTASLARRKSFAKLQGQLGVRRRAAAEYLDRRRKAPDGVVLKLAVYDYDLASEHRLVGSGLVDLGQCGRRGDPQTQMVELQDSQGFYAGCVFVSVAMFKRSVTRTVMFDDDPRTAKDSVEKSGQIDLTVLSGVSLADSKPALKMSASNTRMLWLAAAAVVVYLAIGCVGFSQMEGALYPDAKASTVDGLYFATATLTTVGYGDMGPTNTASRVFAMVFALAGVSYIGLALGLVASKVMDQQEALAEKLALRLAEEVEELADSMAARSRKRDHAQRNKLVRHATSYRVAVEKGGPEEQEASTTTRVCCCIRLDRNEQAAYHGTVKNLLVLLLVLVAGAAFFKAEKPDASVIDCIYFAVITATTIGYGDESPSSSDGRIVGSVYMVVAVLATGRALSALANIPLNLRAWRIKERVLTQFGRTLDRHELQTMVHEFGSNGRVSRMEFVVAMLLKTERLTQADIKSAAAQFDRIDKDRSGRITVADVLPSDEEAKRDKSAVGKNSGRLVRSRSFQLNHHKFKRMQQSAVIAKQIASLMVLIEAQKVQLRELRGEVARRRYIMAKKRMRSIRTLTGGLAANAFASKPNRRSNLVHGLGASGCASKGAGAGDAAVAAAVASSPPKTVSPSSAARSTTVRGFSPEGSSPTARRGGKRVVSPLHHMQPERRDSSPTAGNDDDVGEVQV